MKGTANYDCDSYETRPAPEKLPFSTEDFNHLVEWTHCLVEWGKRVRQDIIKLESLVARLYRDVYGEGAAPERMPKEIPVLAPTRRIADKDLGEISLQLRNFLKQVEDLKAGDPGDPPPQPWGPKK